MTSQLRTYTINRGMMDEWVKLFTETLVPMQEKHGKAGSITLPANSTTCKSQSNSMEFLVSRK